ncbi:MAG TPA: hypothetical protein VEL76_41135 [Gemmataceae bacterium]|nr:hypothetical protein [Gemmataceae bacterium]
MRESQLSKTIEAEGEHKGEVKRSRAYVLEGLRLKFGSPVPEPIRLAIEGTNDLAALDRWFQALFTLNSWAEFEALMKQK